LNSSSRQLNEALATGGENLTREGGKRGALQLERKRKEEDRGEQLLCSKSVTM
jgi:hypothetical protein